MQMSSKPGEVVFLRRSNPPFEQNPPKKTQQKLAQAHRKYKLGQESSFFKLCSRSERTLLFPGLKNVRLNSESVKKFLGELKAAPQETIAKSTFLSTVLSTQGYLQSIEKNEKHLIFVELLAQAKALKVALKALHGQGVEVNVFKGAHTSVQRDQILARFRSLQTNLAL